MRVAVLALLITLAACTPRGLTVGDPVYVPRLEPGAAVMADATRLPMTVYAAEHPRAIIIGLHGFNDYANAYADPGPGPWFKAHDITLYAYDQRGFGHAPGHGYFAGGDAMAADLNTITKLVKARHPNLPLFLMGESMGGAVIMDMMAKPDAPRVDGLILAAPAVWGWRAMNPALKTILWSAARVMPDKTFTGSGLGIRASDNIGMLRANGRDPVFIKATRVSAMYGLVGLMDEAYLAAPKLRAPVLLLYGAHDQIIPAEAIAEIRDEMMKHDSHVTYACYANGWHMLTRDLQRETVWRDVVAWTRDSHPDLPSGATKRLELCQPT